MERPLALSLIHISFSGVLLNGMHRRCGICPAVLCAENAPRRYTNGAGRYSLAKKLRFPPSCLRTGPTAPLAAHGAGLFQMKKGFTTPFSSFFPGRFFSFFAFFDSLKRPAPVYKRRGALHSSYSFSRGLRCAARQASICASRSATRASLPCSVGT